MCCIAFIAKYVLFFFNLLFVLCGIALLSAGIVVLVNISDILELIPIPIDLIPITLIVIGCIIFVIAFFGCCGAITENRCYLIMYAIIMMVMIALNIALAVIMFRNIDGMRDLVVGWLDDAFGNSSNDEAFHALEVTFRCCGTTGYESYTNANLPVPITCCPSDDTAGQLICPVDANFLQGCSEKLGGYFENFGEIIAWGVIGVIVVEGIAALMALYLNSSITSQQRRKLY